jgi:putative two-component system hydrogenase maturation factor HypX/HoxX
MWGVTVLQAEAAMDAGPIWATENFQMRLSKKSSIYRNEVTEAVVRATRTALEHFVDYLAGRWQPTPLFLTQARGQLRPYAKQTDRIIDWLCDDSATVLRKINSADGFPGVADMLFDQPCFLYNAYIYPANGQPGNVLGVSGKGIVRATVDGAIWIGHVRRLDQIPPVKLPVDFVFQEVKNLPELTVVYNDIKYKEDGEVGYLHFDFYNGAMGTSACKLLLEAYNMARRRPTRVIVLMGGVDFFSNGLDLNLIEAADSPADESWRNINAMDDLCQAIIETGSHITVSAMQGGAGAGGAFLGLATDLVWARNGIILNPHYMNMGNLYGSEYWSYLLPRRVGLDVSQRIMQHRLPMGVDEAQELGFIDEHFGVSLDDFVLQVKHRAGLLALDPAFNQQLEAKYRQRVTDEARKPLAQYRTEELALMQRNFYGFDPSYHVARHHFVHKTLHSWTPRHLAKHRELGWVVPHD